MKAQETAALEKALRIRRQVKSRKPKFVRQESWRYKRLKESWRKPKGIDNKMRRKLKGWPRTVDTGYRSPKAARGIHPSGISEVLVYNVRDVKNVDPKTQAVRIAHTVGKKKRVQIIAEAKKRHIIILNAKISEKEKGGEKKEVEQEEKAAELKEETKEKKERKDKAKRKTERKAEVERRGDDAA